MATKHNPLFVAETHVSLLGHTTVADLRRYFAGNEASNGFGNRVGWACVRRSKLLPFGGQVPEEELGDLAGGVRKALAAASKLNRLGMTQKASECWKQVYGDLTNVDPGIVGQVTARAEAHVRRLASIYAAIDGSKVVNLDHLKAGLEIWRFCADSARFLFGRGEVGLKVKVGKILRESGSRGVTRTEISARLSRHVDAEEIRSALESLKASGVAKSRVFSTEGRSAERWYAVRRANDEEELD